MCFCCCFKVEKQKGLRCCSTVRYACATHPIHKIQCSERAPITTSAPYFIASETRQKPLYDVIQLLCDPFCSFEVNLLGKEMLFLIPKGKHTLFILTCPDI